MHTHVHMHACKHTHTYMHTAQRTIKRFKAGFWARDVRVSAPYQHCLSYVLQMSAYRGFPTHVLEFVATHCQLLVIWEGVELPRKGASPFRAWSDVQQSQVLTQSMIDPWLWKSCGEDTVVSFTFAWCCAILTSEGGFSLTL